MKSDAVRDSEIETLSPAMSGAFGRLPWSTPSLRRLRAGLAETGPNLGYDGVEGTS